MDSHDTLNFIDLVLNSFLTGVILMLLGQKMVLLQKTGKLRLVAGGSSLLSVVGSGCSACGLPILSLLGLSGAALYLPFKGAEILYLSFFLLLASFSFLVKNASCSLLAKKSS